MQDLCRPNPNNVSLFHQSSYSFYGVEGDVARAAPYIPVDLVHAHMPPYEWLLAANSCATKASKRHILVWVILKNDERGGI